MKLLLAVLLPVLTLRTASAARASDSFETQEDELKDGEEQLRELEKKIKNKDIPPIEFEFDRAVLRPSSEPALQFVADLLISHPHLKLMVFGHTCSIGREEYNLWLSQERAEAVKTYLIKLGVMGEGVRAKGYGEAKPRATNDTEEGRALNRRVEFVLTTRWWETVY